MARTVPAPSFKRLQDRLFAPAPVQQVGLDGALGLFEAAAVTGQEDAVVAVEQDFERADVVGHAPFGRRHDGRVPGHDVIAGEDDVALVEREAEMVGGVARRVDRGQGPVAALDGVAGLKRAIGHQVEIDEIAALRRQLDRDDCGGLRGQTRRPRHRSRL